MNGLWRQREEQKKQRGHDITMISVTPNYIADESGLWVTEQHWAPSLKAVRIRTTVNA